MSARKVTTSWKNMWLLGYIVKYITALSCMSRAKQHAIIMDY